MKEVALERDMFISWAITLGPKSNYGPYENAMNAMDKGLTIFLIQEGEIRSHMVYIGRAYREFTTQIPFPSADEPARLRRIPKHPPGRGSAVFLCARCSEYAEYRTGNIQQLWQPLLVFIEDKKQCEGCEQSHPTERSRDETSSDETI